MKHTIQTTIDYDLVPLDQINRKMPLTVITELNDGYILLLVGKWADRLHQNSDMFDVVEHKNFQEFVTEQLDGDLDALGEYLIGGKAVALAGADGLFLKYGDLQSDRLLDYFWEVLEK